MRDMLLGQRPSDYDVATDATPQQVRRLFRRVLLVGARFGVAIVVRRGRHVEVATFRSDVSYSDGRRPDAVRFSSAREDALRRDFTINGMFHDPLTDRVIDYVGGRKDLTDGVIRTIGKPDDRFREDYLRLIRAVRFAARFRFRLDRATAAAIRKHARKICGVSGERIFDELSKILARRSGAEGLRACHSLGLARPILPELFRSPESWGRAMDRVESVAAGKDTLLALGALLADLLRADIRKIVRRWGASNAISEALCFFSAHLQDWPVAAALPLCDFKRLLGGEHFGRLLKLWRFEERKATGRVVQSRRITRRARGIPEDRIAPAPFVTGADLLALGMTEGPALGRILHALYDAQLNEELRTRSAALREAHRLMAE